jgi:hypothetical protein
MRLLDAEVLRGRVEPGIERPLLDVRFGPGGGRVVADRERAVVCLPGVAAVGIQDGGRVVVDAEDGVDQAVIDAWLDGLVAALLLAQRGRFALHANLVEVGGRAVAIAGARGAGKTTTSLLLAQRGGRVLGDDVLPLAADGNCVTHRTTGRALRLDRQTAAELALDATADVHGGKLHFRRSAADPGPLDVVVVLAGAGVETVEMRRLAGAGAVEAILVNAYRARILRRAWAAELFEWAGEVAARVPVHLVERPAGGWSGPEVAAVVESIARG